MNARLVLVPAACLFLLAGCGGTNSATGAHPAASGSGAPAASSAPAAAAANYADVPTYHQDAQRSGVSADTPTVSHLAVAWSHTLDGSVYAQPLVVGGTVVVATENDSLYGFSATTGALQWHTSVGTPQQASALPCGNITPTVGITGTPVYVGATGWVYAVAEEAGPVHELVALDPRTGAVRLRQGIDQGAAGTAPAAMQERSALTAAGGRVYVSFGGRAGDCGAYRGQVIGVPVRGGAPVVYTVPTAREAGAWNPAGPAVDAAGTLYVSVGNGAAGEDPGHLQDAYDHSDAVLRLTQALTLTGFFAPADWRTQNAGDVDLGSTGPTLLPGGLLLAVGKSPSVYVARRSDLGGIGGQLATSPVCRAYGGTAVSGSTAYLPCTDGLRAVTVSAGGAAAVGWHAAAAVTGSPVVGGGAVFALDPGAGVLDAVSAATGVALGSVTLPAPTSRFATPALWGPYAFVGTMHGIVAVTGA